jgi:hypothetical protein
VRAARARLAHQHRVVALEVGRAVEVEDALDDLVGVLHLLDGFLAGDGGQLGEAPVVAHLRVDEVLVDGGELRGEDLVQNLDDLRVALHLVLASWVFGVRAGG